MPCRHRWRGPKRDNEAQHERVPHDAVQQSKPTHSASASRTSSRSALPGSSSARCRQTNYSHWPRFSQVVSASPVRPTASTQTRACFCDEASCVNLPEMTGLRGHVDRRVHPSSRVFDEHAPKSDRRIRQGIRRTRRPHRGGDGTFTRRPGTAVQPDFSTTVAEVFLAQTGADMTVFPCEHLPSAGQPHGARSWHTQHGLDGGAGDRVGSGAVDVGEIVERH